jgi:hypothetical protein
MMRLRGDKDEHATLRRLLRSRQSRQRQRPATVLPAEQAAEHRDKLGIAGKVKDVASVHKTPWPDETGNKPLFNIGILTGTIPVYDVVETRRSQES